MTRMPVVLMLLALAVGGLGEGHAAPMSIQVDLNLYFDPSDDGLDIAETFYRPTVLYYDPDTPRFQMNVASLIGDALPSARDPQTFWTEFPDFPRPGPGTTVYGGFLGYYSYCDGSLESCEGESAALRREGLFVGLRPDYAPVDDFDTTFGQGMWPLTEAAVLETMKTPGPSSFDVLDEAFMPLYFNNPGVLPTWQYDAGTGKYTIDMNIWAYSSPVPAGTMHATATFAAVPLPAPLTLMGSAAALLLVAAKRRRRAGLHGARGP